MVGLPVCECVHIDRPQRSGADRELPDPATGWVEPVGLVASTNRKCRHCSLDSEHFRSAPRISPILSGRLSLQQTDCMGRRPGGWSLLAPRAQSGGRSPVLDIGRRDFISLLGGAAATWPLAARAQQPGKVYRIGVFTSGAPLMSKTWSIFIDGLKELGWTEGKNIAFEPRYAENNLDRLPELAAELVRLNVDVILAFGTLAPLAAKRASATVPIVMANAGDPLGSGLVASLARPGGNVTGMSLMAPDLGGKRLELLKEILPWLSRVAVIWNAANPYSALVFEEIRGAAKTLAIELQSLEVRGPGDFDGVLDSAVRKRADALVAVEDPLTFNHRKQIAESCAENRLPAMYGLREYADAGGLLAYGASQEDLLRRAVGFVDKILKGVKPADLPVQQPTKFELVINLKTAKALGLDMPPTLLARADEVIE
jgi:ABC-type uncharacterized transport system substrate-binding protein